MASISALSNPWEPLLHPYRTRDLCPVTAEDRIHRRWRTKLKTYPEVREENRIKSKTRSRVEHVFALIKLKFGFSKVRYRGLAKNLNRLLAACALVNLVTARKHLLQVFGNSCA